VKQVDQIESVVVEEFAFVQRWPGFSEPRIDRSIGCVTVVRYFSSEFALEIELDWHETVVSALVARLDGGALPDGYYVAKGRRCRAYVERLLGGVKSLPSSQRAVLAEHGLKGYGAERMERQAKAYAALIRESGPAILTRAAQVLT